MVVGIHDDYGMTCRDYVGVLGLETEFQDPEILLHGMVRNVDSDVQCDDC